MLIKIKSIEFKYEDEKQEPTSAIVCYSLILDDNQLDGVMTISNNNVSHHPSGSYSIASWPLFEFNRYIYQKIMANM